MATHQPSLLWHDYETWGANPVKDMPAQFAGIRTDLELNIIESPLEWFCQIPNDYLPHPQACLITGITPQQTLRDGLTEAEFAGRIEQEFSRPNTCVVGYNNLRFDDEVTRHLFFRNFYDPYAREWQNGNSRWDIIDMVRACYALRPDGIQWPTRDDGAPSFRLEQLTKANGLGHDRAHDAMSDVYATIDMAKLIKQKQPKLFDYLFGLRKKQAVSELINYASLTPLVHVSSKLPAHNGCATWIVPVCPHPLNRNAIVCLNLSLDPTPLFEQDADELRDRLYRPGREMAEDEQRLPIKLIHMNKSPVLAPAKVMTRDNAQRLGLDPERCLRHLDQIKQSSGLVQKLQDIFDTDTANRDSADPDHALYSGGFIEQADKGRCEQVRLMDPEQLAGIDWRFEDDRLNTLLFRYRARNYPHTLTQDEMQRWQRHRQYRFTAPDSPASLQLEDYASELENLSAVAKDDPNKLAILRALYQYASEL